MTLLILLQADDFSQASLWFDGSTGGSGTDTPLEELADKIAANPKMSVCLALPGELAVTRTFSLPMKRDRDARRAAELLIDDMLARPFDERAVALGVAADGNRMVIAVEADVIASALEAAQAVGIEPDTVTVDHALLPANDEAAEETSVTALRLGQRVAMRVADGAFTSEASFAQGLFEGRESETLREVQPEGLIVEGMPNFRTGRFSKRRALPDFRPYALAASIMVVAGIVFLASSFVEGVRYAGGASTLRQEAEANFRRGFPGTPIVDMERQIQANRVTAQSSDFLPLSAILAELIAEQDTTTLSSLTYAASGELTAELTVVSIPDLEAITEELNARGIDVQEAGDVRREDGALVARLFLRVA